MYDLLASGKLTHSELCTFYRQTAEQYRNAQADNNNAAGANLDNGVSNDYAVANNNDEGGTVNGRIESGVPSEAGGNVSNGETGAPVGINPDGETTDRGISPLGADGRADTELHGVVRLSDTSKQALANSSIPEVEFENFSAEPAVFSSALDAARTSDSENGWAATPQSPEALAERGVELFMSTDEAAGFGITPTGDIIGVFKNGHSCVDGVFGSANFITSVYGFEQWGSGSKFADPIMQASNKAKSAEWLYANQAAIDKALAKVWRNKKTRSAQKRYGSRKHRLHW